MKFVYSITLVALLCISANLFAQDKLPKKIKLKGIVVEKVSKQALEYATISLVNASTLKIEGGGITNNKGEFEVAINAGVYDLKIEFISFKTSVLKNQQYTENKNLGTLTLEEDFTQLNQVEVRAEKSTVEIKLDKKVYNVGQDLVVKGGTVSDVLDNIPSVTVDVEGNVALRGNDNVRILIDGKPTNAINISEALRLIPADAIDKVEVITNPSARYDAEGGGGILNIILKKGKNQGINGTILASVGTPENSGLSGNVNMKSELANFFTTIGYNKRNGPGNVLINQQNFDNNNNLVSYIEERRTNQRLSEGFNSIVGMELFLDKTSSWTNSISIRKNNGGNPENVFYNEYLPSGDYFKSGRFNDIKRTTKNVEFNTNYIKNFNKQGHKLTIDGSFSVSTDLENSRILGTDIIPVFAVITNEITKNTQRQSRNLIQADYVYPFGKSQFEAGFRGNYSSLFSDFNVQEDLTGNGTFTINPFVTGILDYQENVTAAYTQFGSKYNKISYLFGLRMEDSFIVIDQISNAIKDTKRYVNYFPSVFLNYTIKEGTNVTLSYSKRINRPRDRFINPFSSYSSNINLFFGNPDLDPALSDVYEIGILKKWKQITLNSSVYVNNTTNSFQIVRKERGDFINGIPVIINTPFNLSTDTKLGFEFTLNYSPYKWWRLNSNFNFFQNKTDGRYTYTRTTGEVVNIDFKNSASSWFTRLTSKINLPYKIDWQTNFTYNGPQRTAQGKSLGIASANIGFSKDVLKEKGTVAFNVNDVFNSRKRINDLVLPNVNSYSEMQWHQRQVTLSFTYRFNKLKTDKEKMPRRDSEGGGGEDY
ncbi:MAG: TonB-dependent receptor [Flavobacterium sp.]|nr:TonB-dependent receptor [Flavobacterium sp.]